MSLSLEVTCSNVCFICFLCSLPFLLFCPVCTSTCECVYAPLYVCICVCLCVVCVCWGGILSVGDKHTHFSFSHTGRRTHTYAHTHTRTHRHTHTHTHTHMDTHAHTQFESRIIQRIKVHRLLRCDYLQI